jgi:hypothetical protein
MNTEIAKQVSEVLDVLAQKFGSTVEHLWGILIKQAYVEGIISLVWVIISIIVGTISIKYIIKFFKEEDDGWEGMLFAICFGLIALSALVFCLNINDTIRALVNPEFYAIKEIFGQLK